MTSKKEEKLNTFPPIGLSIGLPPISPSPPPIISPPINAPPENEPKLSELEIVKKRSSTLKQQDLPELRKLKINRPSFDPLDGIDPEKFQTKREAYLAGYVNALYHRLDGAKKVK